MYYVLATLLLGLTAAVHGAAFFGGRRVVARAFGGKAAAGSFGFAAARGVAGVAGWYLAGSLQCAIGLLGGGETVIDETSMRVRVAEGPAARAGVRDGDRIVTAAGVPIHSWDQLKILVSTQTEPIALEIDRGGQAITLTATPEGSPPKLRVFPWTEHRSMGIGHAMFEGLLTPGKIVATSFRGLLRTVAGAERAEVTGPVGIVRETSTTMRQGVAGSLRLSAAIASYMLPFVALGSALYELLARRGRPV